jgi:hypothetical protein
MGSKEQTILVQDEGFFHVVDESMIFRDVSWPISVVAELRNPWDGNGQRGAMQARLHSAECSIGGGQWFKCAKDRHLHIWDLRMALG